MPINLIDFQRRLREAGRIRVGEQVTTRNGKKAPAKLDHFRLTSSDKRALDMAAAAYGGEVVSWPEAPVGEQYQLKTTAKRLPVIVPPGDTSFTQWLELWSGGGCLRRCDGEHEVISDGPCVCDPDNRECRPHTRLSVILADLPGIGVWRLDTQGYYAATELAGTVDVLRAMNGRGQMVDAWLVLEQRQVKRPGEPTKNFPVVALDLDLRVRELMQAPAPRMVDTATGEIAAPRITPVPALPAPSVAEQVAAVNEPKPRRRTGAALPPTGLAPRPIAAVQTTEPTVLVDTHFLPPTDGGGPSRMTPQSAVSADDLRALQARWKALEKPYQDTYAEERAKYGLPVFSHVEEWTLETYNVALRTIGELEASMAGPSYG